MFQRGKLAAWCIVPFDSMKRGPVQRAEMLNRLGITRLAYDWRAEHIPTFEAEVDAMASHGIEISAWWMPASLDETALKILDVIGQKQIHPQLWVLIGDPPAPDQEGKVKAAAAQIRPIAEAARKAGCKLGLYNHGGWFGEPDNQIAILKELDMPEVGMVYNFHHGHSHIASFKELFERMKPHLIALNINGMVVGGPETGRKIIPVGSGDQEKRMIEVVADSGWTGPVGVLCHLDEDAERILRGNLSGIERITEELAPANPGSSAKPPN